MKILQLFPRAFGKFHLKEPLDLAPGLNILTGRNDMGKSTLHAFILGMLYGFKDEGRLRVVRTDEFEKYRPWQGRDYAGTLVYEHDGRTYRVERSFDPDETRIYDGATGEDITSRFSLDGRKEYDFARRHLGLGMREFVNTIWIGQPGSRQEPGLGYFIRARMADLVETGDDLPVAFALNLLERERHSIKGSGRTRAELDILRHEIADLEEEARQALIREEETRELARRAAEKEREKKEVEERVRALETEMLSARYCLLKRTLSEASALCESIQELEREAETLRWAGSSGVDSEKMLASVEAEIQDLVARKTELQSKADALQRRIEEVQSELEDLGDVTRTRPTELDIAMKHEAYVKAQKEMSRLARLLNDAREVVARIESEGRMAGYIWLDALDQGFVENARYVASQVESVEAQSRSSASEVERVRAQVEAMNPWRTAVWLYSLGVAVGGVAGASYVYGESWWWLVAGSAGVSVLAGLLFNVLGYRARAEKLALLRLKEEEALAMGARAAEARRALKGLLSEVRVGTIEELLGLWNDLSSWRERRKSARMQLDKVLELVSEASQDYERARGELAALVSKLPSAGNREAAPASTAPEMSLRTEDLPVPADADLESAGGFDVRVLEALRESVRHAAELRKDLAGCQEAREEVLRELASVEERMSELERSRREVLAAEGVSSAEELAAKAESARRLRELDQNLVAVRARLASVLGEKTLQELESEVRELESRVGSSWLPPGEGELQDARALSLERERARSQELLAELERMKQVIASRCREGRPLYEIDEELQVKRARADALANDAEALRLAHEILLEVSGKMKREFVPVLARRAGEILATITGSKYGEVRVSPDLEMTVMVPGAARAARIESLSTGTVDQGYLALRLALVELLSGRKDFPLFFDAPFVHYDDERLEGALRIIGDLARTHQVVIFTHESRIPAVLKGLEIEANVIRLEDIPPGNPTRGSPTVALP